MEREALAMVYLEEKSVRTNLMKFPIIVVYRKRKSLFSKQQAVIAERYDTPEALETFEMMRSDESGRVKSNMVVIDSNLKPVRLELDIHHGEGVEVFREGSEPLDEDAKVMLAEAGLK